MSKKKLTPVVQNKIGSIYTPNGWQGNKILSDLVNRMININRRYNENNDVISVELYNDLFSKFSTVNSNLQWLRLEDEYNNDGLLKEIERILDDIENGKLDEGGRRNKPAYDTMTMKDIKELCKANQIKLSRVVNDKRIVYKKKELLTKLKRKKVI